MLATYIASFLHLVFSYTLLRIVPIQKLYLFDLVAFPVSLFLLSRDIVVDWYLPAAPAKANHNSGSQRPSTAASSCTAEKSQSTSSAVKDANEADAAPRRRLSDKTASEDADHSETTPMTTNESDCNKHAARRHIGGRLSFAKILLLLVHLVSFGMVLDFVYRPILSPGDNLVVFRPGYVSHDSAKLHIRFPEPNRQLEVRYKELASSDKVEFANNAPWESHVIHQVLTNNTDYTTTLRISHLTPATKYLVELFSSSREDRAASSVLHGSMQIKTAPVPGTPMKYRFATGSCIKPNFPYTPTTSPDVFGFANMLDHSDDLDMIMFLGDFIYADLPFYFGPEPEDYRRLYRQVYMTKSAQRLLNKVPMLHVYDDHEIVDNWHNQDKPPMGAAMRAYHEYNGEPNPDPVLAHHAYYNFTVGDIAFYAWDTRRYRTDWETADDHAKTMLGDAQKHHFMQWLHDVNHTAAVKFVISSVPVTAGWTNVDSGHDTWRGYMTERAEILNATQYVPNLYYLSGDRHEMAAVILPSGNVEFSTSPVSQFTFPLIGEFKDGEFGEQTLHFRREGHVKFGILDVDTETNPGSPRVTYSLYTADEHDAKRPVWTYEHNGVPWR